MLVAVAAARDSIDTGASNSATKAWKLWGSCLLAFGFWGRYQGVEGGAPYFEISLKNPGLGGFWQEGGAFVKDWLRAVFKRDCPPCTLCEGLKFTVNPSIALDIFRLAFSCSPGFYCK